MIGKARWISRDCVAAGFLVAVLQDEIELEKEEGEEERGEEGKYDAGLSVTQSNDPRSGGHFALGVSKAPPGPARDRGIIDQIVGAFEMADGENTRRGVERESPIPNGLTTVGGAKTRFGLG